MIRRSRGSCHGCRTRSSRLPSGIVLTYFRQRGHFGIPRPFHVSTRPTSQRAEAERIIAATAKIEARQLWSVAAAMCLALLPVATVIAGIWMAVAGLITGVQWAVDMNGSV